jgi:hypothetical protein
MSATKLDDDHLILADPAEKDGTGVGTDRLYQLFTNLDPENPPNILRFLSEDTLNFLKRQFAGRARAEESLADLKSLTDTWVRVLVDAIYFLRINDSREKHFFIKQGDILKKSTMKERDVAASAQSNVYGIEELAEYFKQFEQFESTLYGADEYYRDHVIHLLNVWFIGLNILEKHGESFKMRVLEAARIKNASDLESARSMILSEGEPESRPCLSTAELSAMWSIIALTHDLGYPLEKVEKVNDELEKMLSKFGKIGFSRSRFSFETQHDHLVRFMLNLISSVAKVLPEDQGKWKTHVRSKYYAKFSKSWESFDHGIVSSLILLKSLTFFIEVDYCMDLGQPIKIEDARQFAIRSEILHAIASHTTPKIYHLTTNNLPFLLVLCDDIQEWSRPTFGDMKSGIKGNAISVIIEKVEIGQISSTIHCLLQYKKASFQQQAKFAVRALKSWHERFRPALGDEERSLDFSWKIQFGEDAPWVFRINTKGGAFKEITTSRPKDDNCKDSKVFNLYDSTYA